MQRVVAQTVAGNQASRRVLVKSGLIQVDSFASTGSGTDTSQAEQVHVGYELTRADWQARAS